MTGSPKIVSRTGKVARLPVKIRDEICRRLENGERGVTINAWLNGQPAIEKILRPIFGDSWMVSDMNMSVWRRSGYADWRRRQESLARTKDLARYAAEQAAAGGGSIAEGAVAIAAGKLLEALEDIETGEAEPGAEEADPAEPKKLSPESLVKFSAALAALRTVEQQSIRLELEKKKVGQKDEQLALEWEKFRREMAATALRVLKDDRARQIEAGTGSNAEKIEAMGRHLFGDLWKSRK